jgi:hypothetical protein
MLVQYQSVSAEYRLSRPIEALEPLIPRLSSYLLADQSGLTSWVGKSVGSFPTRLEHQMFIGVGALLFLLVGLFAVVSKRYLSIETRRLGMCVRDKHFDFGWNDCRREWEFVVLFSHSTPRS